MESIGRVCASSDMDGAGRLVISGSAQCMGWSGRSQSYTDRDAMAVVG